MAYNSLNNDQALGLIYFINDVNQRFNDLLFTDISGLESNYLGLARIDVREGIPHVKSSDGEYEDALYNDQYDIVTFFMESADRKMQKAAATESKLDLYVSVNMNSFKDGNGNPIYQEEGIINEVWEVMKSTSLEPETLVRDAEVIKIFAYESKIPDSMYPFFVFKISSKIVGNLKVN